MSIVLEVYQFARDAAVAEAWLIAQEPYLSNQDLGVCTNVFYDIDSCVQYFSLLTQMQSVWAGYVLSQFRCCQHGADIAFKLA